MRHCKKLEIDVDKLCHELRRPISSRDLLRYYKRNPEARPFLFQALGQLLFKLGRPKTEHSARIFRIGIIGNLAFYAPSEDEAWKAAFSIYSAQVAIAQQCRFRLPDYASRLIGSRFEPMARNALAGFLEEWCPVVGKCGGLHLPILDDMEELISIARQHAAPRFCRIPPGSLVDRGTAAQILRSEYGRRTPLSNCEAMNVDRHLVHLKWPQSRLFGSSGNMFWSDQVGVYCASRWPVAAAEHELARGLSLVMIYGSGS